MPSLQWNRSHVLTDRLECPDCAGTGRQIIGSLRLACRFCGGRGYVGGDHEPADDNVVRPMRRPVWHEPAAKTLTVCQMCFGTKKVVNLGGTGEPTGYMIEMPCPACGKPDGEAHQV